MNESLMIQHRTFVNVSPNVVYGTLTTGEGWDAWFTQGTTVEANRADIFISVLKILGRTILR
ncbi:hypothetical protein [Paenibacillus silviterrae]|uniref:hypothetical protein n=1 Tax=Paenibacillus silviterrae TaxID=3242194 RepID=UPI002543292A|nr:hypothetical protein [Paenibacillus chinjuensis]